MGPAFRYQALRNEAWIGGGVRLLPTYGDFSNCQAIAGRPLRSTDGIIVPAQRPMPPSAASAREYAAHAFALDAAHEAASVSAFIQLACELLAVGAPESLIARAIVAAWDEIGHAQLCACLAERALVEKVDCALPAIQVRAAPDAQTALTRLAIESWLDGCLGEASAAHHAAAAADTAQDLYTTQVLRRVAREEARHGELAWDVLAFCVQRGGQAVRQALQVQCDYTHHGPDVTVPDALEHHGRLSARSLAAISERQRSRSLERLRERGHLRT
jgi:hypothetical protein